MHIVTWMESWYICTNTTSSCRYDWLITNYFEFVHIVTWMDDYAVATHIVSSYFYVLVFVHIVTWIETHVYGRLINKYVKCVHIVTRIDDSVIATHCKPYHTLICLCLGNYTHYDLERELWNKHSYHMFFSFLWRVDYQVFELEYIVTMRNDHAIATHIISTKYM